MAPSDVGGALEDSGLGGALGRLFISDGLVSKGVCGYLHDADVICAGCLLSLTTFFLRVARFLSRCSR